MEQDDHNDYTVQLLYLTSQKNNPSSCISEYVRGPFHHHHLKGQKVSYLYMLLNHMHETTEHNYSSNKQAYGRHTLEKQSRRVILHINFINLHKSCTIVNLKRQPNIKKKKKKNSQFPSKFKQYSLKQLSNSSIPPRLLIPFKHGGFSFKKNNKCL